MPNWSGGILTTKGQSLQAKVDAGQTTLTITKMKIGSGVLPSGQNLQSLNDLVTPEMNVPISAVSANANISTITGVITNAGLTNGFNVRELGVFAQDPTLGEILYSITIDSAPDYLPPEGGSVTVSSEFSYDIVVSNAASITATIHQNGLVTASILENHNKDPLAHNLLAALHLWQPTHVYAVGDICYSPSGASYKFFECTVAGISGATEPIWGTVGSTVTDGSAQWAVRDLRVGVAQFDNSEKLATTEFVKKSGLQIAATAQYTAGPITLTAAQAGQLVDLASGYTGAITLPDAATIPDGSVYYFWSGANAAVTVQRSGSDTIYINNSTVTSINLNSGDSLVLMKTGILGSGAWIAIGGSAQMIAAGSIVSSGTNWIKFADGTMIQKASATLVSNVTVQTNYRYAVGTFTFPLAFVNTAYATQFIHTGHIPIMFTEYNSDSSKTASQVKCTAAGVEINLSGVASFRTDLPWTVICTAIGRWKA